MYLYNLAIIELSDLDINVNFFLLDGKKTLIVLFALSPYASKVKTRDFLNLNSLNNKRKKHGLKNDQ